MRKEDYFAIGLGLFMIAFPILLLSIHTRDLPNVPVLIQLLAPSIH